MIATSLLSLVLACQSAATVTLHQPATKLATILAAVTQQTGRSLSAEDPVGDELFVVEAQAVKPDELLARIAELTFSEWQTRGDRQVLVRDNGAMRVQLQREQKQRVDAYRTALALYLQQMSPAPAIDAQLRAQIQKGLKSEDIGSALNPQDRLLAQLLSDLDINEIVSLPAEGRAVFSNRPTAMQRKFGPHAEQALQVFADAYGAWHEATFPDSPQNPYSPPYRALLILSKWTSLGDAYVELKIVDSQNRTVANASTNLSVQIAQNTDKATPFLDNHRIKLSTDSMMLSSLQTNDQGSIAKLPASLRQRLLDPEHNDPLSFNVSELLMGIAKASSKPFVGAVTDSMWQSGTGVSTNQSADMVRAQLTSSREFTFRESQGWLIAEPRMPIEARQATLDRTQLRSTLSDMERNGGPSLDIITRLSRKAKSCLSENLAVNYGIMLYPEVASAFDYSSWAPYRLYDTLTPQDRATAAKGTTTTFGRVGATTQRAIVSMVLFSVTSSPLNLFTSATPGQEDDLNTIQSEPTEAFAGGIPASVRVTFKRDDSTVLVSPGNVGATMTPEELGTQLAMHERPDLFQWVTESPLPGRYATAQNTTFRLSLFLPPHEGIPPQVDGSLPDMTNTPFAEFAMTDIHRTGSQSFTLANIPDAILKLVEAARKEARESFKSMQNEQGRTNEGGTIPPSQPRR